MHDLVHRDPLTNLAEWALSMHVFQRNRVSVMKKVVTAALCNSGYSYRKVAGLVGGMSYIAVRDSFQAMVTSLPEESKRFRREVAVDGKDVRFDGRTFHLWLARDVDSGEILEFGASPDAAPDDGARFLARVAAQCANRPILRLGEGQNAPRGLMNLDLYFQNATPQSLMERLGRIFLGSAS